MYINISELFYLLLVSFQRGALEIVAVGQLPSAECRSLQDIQIVLHGGGNEDVQDPATRTRHFD